MTLDIKGGWIIHVDLGKGYCWIFSLDVVPWRSSECWVRNCNYCLGQFDICLGISFEMGIHNDYLVCILQLDGWPSLKTFRSIVDKANIFVDLNIAHRKGLQNSRRESLEIANLGFLSHF